MTVDVCSAMMYDSIKKSGYVGKRQAMFLYIFMRENRPLTRIEVNFLVNSEFGSKSLEKYDPRRISELKRMGFLTEYDIVHCHHSQQRVNRWKWTGRTEPMKKYEVCMTCPRCKGMGTIKQDQYYP